MTNPLSAKDLIKGAQPQRRSTRINLRGDLRAELETLEIELADARDQETDSPRSNARLTDVSPAVAIARRIKDVEDQMAESWLKITMQAKSAKDWRAFKATHPAREEVQEDAIVSMNFDDIVFDFMPTCVVEPVLDTEDWEGIFEKAAPADLRELGGMAYALHERVSDVPKSRLASVIRRTNEDDSELPSDSESVSDDSTDGNPSSSPSTSMQTVAPAEPGMHLQQSPQQNPNTTS